MKNLLIGLCVALSLFACTKKDNGKVVATINSEKITFAEFNKELDKIPMDMKMMVVSESGKKNFLDRMIVKKLLLAEAKKNNIEKDKEFQQRLADIKEQLIIESLLKKKLTSDTKLSEEESKKYYEENKERFKKDQEINTRHILLKSEDEARQVREKLQAGEDFVNLAKMFSIDPNAKVTGGEVGFHPKGTLLPEYEAAAFKLTRVGQVSGIVKTQFGYHIIRLEGVKPPAYVSYDEVKEFIKQQLAQERQAEILEKYIDDLKAAAKITINEEMFKAEKQEGTEQPETKNETGKEGTGQDKKPQPKNETGPAKK